MKIATSSIKDWSKVDDTGGSITLDNNLVNIQTATTAFGDRAYIFKRISANPGETIKVKFRAKVASGQSVAIIDYPGSASAKITQLIDSQDWQEYTLVYTVHDFSAVTDYFQVVIGHATGYSGEVDISEITIDVENSRLPVARCYCAALLTINNGAGNIEPNVNFSFIGIDREHLALQSVSTQVTIKVPFVYGSNGAQAAPILYADLTHDQTGTLKVCTKIGKYDRDTGEVTIKFIDMTTGNLIDISSLGPTYLWVTGFGI